MTGVERPNSVSGFFQRIRVESLSLKCTGSADESTALACPFIAGPLRNGHGISAALADSEYANAARAVETMWNSRKSGRDDIEGEDAKHCTHGHQDDDPEAKEDEGVLLVVLFEGRQGPGGALVDDEHLIRIVVDVVGLTTA